MTSAMTAVVGAQLWDLMTDEEWASAVCNQIDAELFFPGKGGSVTLATGLCIACPVRRRCLVWALLKKEEDGIWGGMSPNKRIALSRAIRAQSGERRLTIDMPELHLAVDRVLDPARWPGIERAIARSKKPSDLAAYLFANDDDPSEGSAAVDADRA